MKGILMNRKALTFTALAATLLVGTSAATAFAYQNKGQGRGPEARFVYMLQEFDANKDGQISKDEAKTAQEKMFTTVDADSDGVLTPGEFRTHREAMRAAHQATGMGQGPQGGSGPGVGPKDGTGAQNAQGRGNGPKDGSGRQYGMMRMGNDDDGQGRGMRHGGHGMRDGGQGHGVNRGGQMGGQMGGMRMADADGNGQISKEEAVAAADQLFARMDTNADGVLSAADMPKRNF